MGKRTLSKKFPLPPSIMNAADFPSYEPGPEQAFPRSLSDDTLSRIRYHVHLSCHRTKEDCAGFEEQARLADVIVPELFGHDPHGESAFFDDEEDVSSAIETFRACHERRISVRSAMRTLGMDGFRRAQLSVLRRLPRKTILIADCAQESRLEGDAIVNDILLDRINHEPAENFTRHLDACRMYLREDIRIETEREADIIGSLNIQLVPLLAMARNELKVLLQYGNFHTGLAHLLRRQGSAVDVTHPERPYLQPLVAEAMLRLRNNGDIDDETVAKAWIELECMKHDEQPDKPRRRLLPQYGSSMLSLAALRFGLYGVESKTFKAYFRRWREAPKKFGPLLRRLLKQQGMEQWPEEEQVRSAIKTLYGAPENRSE